MHSESSQSGDDHLAQLREQLRYWPHTIHRIDDTLDISLIEGRAKQLLFQAINSKNLSAFVGSGLSAAYGRLTWRDWKTEQVRIVERNTKSFLALCETAISLQEFYIELLRPYREGEESGEFAQARKNIHTGNGEIDQKERHNVWRWLRARYRATKSAQHHIRGLYQTNKLAQSGEGSFPGGEELPVQFEIAQKLQNELHKHLGLFFDLSDELKSPSEYLKDARFGALETADTAVPADTIASGNGAGGERFREKLKKRLNETNLAALGGIQSAYEEKYEELAQALEWPEARLDFEMLAKTLLVDECAHAWLNLRKGLLSGMDVDDGEVDPRDVTKIKQVEDTHLKTLFSSENLRRDIRGIRDLPDRYKVLSPFRLCQIEPNKAASLERLETMTKIEGDVGDQIASTWADFRSFMVDTLNLHLERFQTAGDQRRYLSPGARFLVPTFLALLEDRNEAIERVEQALSIETTKLDFTSRRSILADRHDPLPKITANFGIKRFITTNYDFEIERYFQDRGYRSFPLDADDGHESAGKPSDDLYRSDPIGGVLKDQTFDRTKASQLTSFALEQDINDASVYHLHGRATVDDKLVVTEQDYMSLYLRQDEYRDTVDEGITMAFAASPMLFLGLGMEETDLLRPLRQFISNRDRTVGYTSIALLPAEKSITQRTKFSSALFLRYGVHTIYYGSGKVTIGEQGYGIDWLHRITRLIETCRDLTKSGLKGDYPKDAIPTEAEKNQVIAEFKAEGRSEDEAVRTAAQRKIVAYLSEQVGTVSEDLADAEVYPDDTPALGILLGVAMPGKASTEGKHWDLAKKVAGQIKKADFKNPPATHSLRTCVFTATRPQAKRPETLHDTKIDTDVDGHFYVGFQTGMLNEILRMTVDLPTSNTAPNNELKRDFRARLIALDGLQGSFLTGCLNASLEALQKEQKAWLENWKEIPPFRQAMPQCADSGDGVEYESLSPATLRADANSGAPTRYIRHRIDNVISSFAGLENLIESDAEVFVDQGATKGRLKDAYRTRIRAFDMFITAAQQTIQKRFSDDSAGEKIRLGRRQLITVAAHRGLGKGTFVSAFSTRRGVDLYQRAVWQGGNAAFTSALFFNLGMSPEIASVYEMFQRVLIETICGLKAPFVPRNESPRSRISWDDLRADPDLHLRTLRTFERYDNRPGSGAAFEKDGFCKVKAELRDALMEELRGVSRISALRTLLQRFNTASEEFVSHHESGAGAPRPRLLLVLSAAELLFTSDSKVKNNEIRAILDLLMGPDMRSTPIDIVFIGSETALGGQWSESRREKDPLATSDGRLTTWRVEMRRDEAWTDVHAVEHISRRLEAGRIEIDDPGETLDPEWDELHFIHVARPMSSIDFTIDNFPVLVTGLHLTHPPKPKTANPGAESCLAAAKAAYDKAVKKGRENSDKAMDEEFLRKPVPTAAGIAQARGKVFDKVATDVTANLRSYMALTGKPERLPDDTAREKDQLRALLHLRVSENPKLRDEWRNLRRYVGSSRIAITMLMAAAEHMIIHASDPTFAAGEAERFINSTVASVRSVGRARSDEMVLEAVLTSYRRLHRIGDPDLDAEFHLMILRHLAVIGTPVSAGVMVRLPEFRKYFERLGVELPHSRRRFVFRALTVMAYRGLVFRIAPHPRQVKLAPKDEDWPAKDDFRWALHRLVQRFGVNKLKPHLHDPVVINTFAPTLYTSIPSAGPKLSEANYVFLRSLLIGLSQYPDVPNIEHGIEPWLFTTQNRAIRAQALRAALSLVRSTLSIAVISKLDERPTRYHDRAPKRGHLETYRVRLRWIVRMAWYFIDKTDFNRESYDPAQPKKWLNALYRDEIVWLYNELGVVCLAQGNLTDALGYLRQAAEINELIEGSSRAGPLFNHIDLNHAIVQFERGRFASARERLVKVMKSAKNQEDDLYWAAEGYLCVLDHVSGKLDGLAQRYKAVTRYFQATKDDRAAALFLMHRGRFLFREDTKEARRLIRLARSLSETSGHEDIRHHVELALVRLRHPESQDELPVVGDDLKTLQEIEQYARSMSIWSLQADALRMRAGILLAQGETSTAGRLLVRSMAIARRHSMSLRLNSAMTAYAEVLLRRGDISGARHVAEMSLEWANGMGYRIEADRAHRVLSRCD